MVDGYGWMDDDGRMGGSGRTGEWTYVDARMDGFLGRTEDDRWVDGGVDGRADRDRREVGRTAGWWVGWADGRTGWAGRWTDCRMVGRMGGRVDG